MARKREFSPEEALLNAMHAFWRKGYNHTSLTDLVEETGVGKKGLYTVFGSKLSLYIKALEHYKCLQTEDMLTDLEKPGASVNEIRSLFNHALMFTQSENGKRGCMVGNAIAEFGNSVPEVKKAVREHVERFRQAIYKALYNSKIYGEIPSGIKIEKHSYFLCSILLALMIQSRAGYEYSEMKNSVETALKTLE